MRRSTAVSVGDVIVVFWVLFSIIVFLGGLAFFRHHGWQWFAVLACSSVFAGGMVTVLFCGLVWQSRYRLWERLFYDPPTRPSEEE